MPRSLWTPADPRRTHQNRSLCVGFWHVETIAICFGAANAADSVTGLYQGFGKCGFPEACPELVEGACVIPCVRFNRLVRLLMPP
jgi:hypothetical protein